jgi:hypothetical protein
MRNFLDELVLFGPGYIETCKATLILGLFSLLSQILSRKAKNLFELLLKLTFKKELSLLQISYSMLVIFKEEQSFSSQIMHFGEI